jgi:hypothetical protein
LPALLAKVAEPQTAISQAITVSLRCPNMHQTVSHMNVSGCVTAAVLHGNAENKRSYEIS